MQIDLELPTLHDKQQFIIDNAKRYNVLKCGRRFGKTVLTCELAIQPLLDGKIVGMWQPTYKDLHDVWIEIKSLLQPIISEKSESVKQIRLITGGILDMWSMEEPNNGRGRKYHRVIIDECEKAKKFEEAWKFAIQPTLADYGGDAWFMSTPKFGMTFFKSLAKKKDNKWNSWVFNTYDNPHIPKQEIDELREQMDDLTFQCEIMAQDIDIVDKPFAYSFNPDKHLKECSYNPDYELYLSFDFNRDPITCICAQMINEELIVFKEYKIPNSNIYELCERIKTDFPYSVYIITGDATGKNGSAMVKDSLNYYLIIQQLLQVSKNQIKVPTVNPSIEQNRSLLNSVLQHGNITINPENKHLIFDLKYVQVDDIGKIIKDRSTEAAKADLLDCFRYLVNLTHRNFIKNINNVNTSDIM